MERERTRLLWAKLLKIDQQHRAEIALCKVGPEAPGRVRCKTREKNREVCENRCEIFVRLFVRTFVRFVERLCVRLFVICKI
jgi:hypothetical protein